MLDWVVALMRVDIAATFVSLSHKTVGIVALSESGTELLVLLTSYGS